jgi:uncharacterized protein (DUF488 family)
MSATLFTIGFTGKNARQFFGALRLAGVRKVIDVRLKNVSQLAGFTKRDDLEFFLDQLWGCGYEHRPQWAPSPEILEEYKNKALTWEGYAQRFAALLDERLAGYKPTAEDLDRACLLCSEPTAEKCHRRLLAERLQALMPGLRVKHL